MNVNDDNLLDDQIRKAASCSVPGAIDLRLRSQLSELRLKLGEAGPAPSLAAQWKRAGWLWPALASAAALGLAVLVTLLVPRQASLAEVANAVLDQAWVHLHVRYQDNLEGEEWISPSRQIWASRHPRWIQYEDYRLQVYDWFEPEENAVYRGPVVWRSRAEGLASMTATLRLLLQQGRPVEQPLASLDFLGPGREAMKILDQRVDHVTEQGRTWLDYRLTVTEPNSSVPLRMFFRVDPLSRLPWLCRIEGVRDGKPGVYELRFEYPEKGPASIYDLGVRKTAKLVDRIPTGDIKRILETIRAGRERMDDYRAVFVQRLEGLDYMWWTEDPEIFYRKGNKFRRDFGCDWKGARGATKRPADGDDLGKWWSERTRVFRYYPECVVRGSKTYVTETKTVTDPDGSQHQDIVSVSSWESDNWPGEIYPPEWSMRPEFACRPPLGIGDPHLEPVLDLHPTEGPAGCILLRIRHTSTQGRLNEKGLGIADRYRYWLDPQRDFIVMRSDMIMDGQGRKENITETDTIEETARSPQAVWYATKVRRHFPGPDGKATSRDQVYQIYMDFKADLPDSLFEPPRKGRVY
jgi:hypothetical protein